MPATQPMRDEFRQPLNDGWSPCVILVLENTLAAYPGDPPADVQMAAFDARDAALLAAMSTPPTTLAGAIATLRHAASPVDDGDTVFTDALNAREPLVDV